LTQQIRKPGEIFNTHYPKNLNIFAFSFGKKTEKIAFWLSLKVWFWFFPACHRTKRVSYCSSSHTCAAKASWTWCELSFLFSNFTWLWKDHVRNAKSNFWPETPWICPFGFIIMDNFDGLLEVLYISTLSHGVSLNIHFLCPFWKLDVALLFEFLHFSIQVLVISPAR